MQDLYQRFLDYISFEKVIGWLADTGVELLVIIVVFLVLIRITKTLASKIEGWILREDSKFAATPESRKRAETISRLARQGMRAVITLMFVITLLAQLGIDIKAILAGAGVLGLAVGMGAQSIIKDMINGFLVLVEDHYRVGDVVTLAGIGGLVENIHLRTTRLRDLSGNVHIIPNGEVRTVTNMTRDFSRCVLDVGVAYKESVDRVIEVLKELGTELRQDEVFGPKITADMEVLGVDKLGDNAVTVRIRFETKPIEQWNVMREMNRRIKNKFDELDIEIPFPHRTVYFRDEKWPDQVDAK